MMATIPIENRPETDPCASEERADAPVIAIPANKEIRTCLKPVQDKMTIMAAVAMTELFGGKLTSSTHRPSTESLHHTKEPLGVLSSPEVSGDEECAPPAKRVKRSDESNSSVEETPSRNPSPTSVVLPQPPHTQHFIHRPPPVHHRNLSQNSYPPYHHHQQPQPFPPYRPPDGRHASRMKTVYPPMQLRFPFHPSPARVSSYEDVMRTSGLPKALSFRKICSRCGKTRGEHGELGFGNKCEFENCGKCGASLQRHKDVGCCMGILCNLSVEQGATMGASEAYSRKIRDLAARAEIQKTMMDDKRMRVERLAAQQHFIPTS